MMVLAADGDSELAIELTGKSADECHRDEHGAQHQHDGNDGPGDFAHGGYAPQRAD